MKKIFNFNNIKFLNEKRLSSYFACLMSFLIAVIIIVTTNFVMHYVKNISSEYSNNIKSFNYIITSLLFQSFAEKYETKDFEPITRIAAVLKTNNMLSYAYAVDSHTKRIIWSTEENLIGKTYADINEKTFQHIDLTSVQDVKGSTENYSMVLGLSQGKVQSNNLHIMFENMKMFIVIFLIIGLIASAFMSRLVNRPLVNLAKGVKEFANGNLNYRLKKTGFVEINELVSAYNQMASQLLELYSSLEQKVQERTIELQKANEELKEAQAMMVHSEKMRSLGELVAGIAHEINNPINFIYGNIMILDKYSKDMLSLIEKYTQNEDNIPPEKRIEIEKMKTEIDIEFIQDDIKELIRSCIEGTERTKNIILDLKNFSRMEEMVMTQFDIPKEIDTTLNILNNKYKNRITVHKEYEPDVPKIEAYGGQLNQVFMNILDNAQGAIHGNGDVYIRVKKDANNVVIEFQDTGVGIKKENLEKVFDPFFTTKPVGQGTGLGMSISYRVIQNHSGNITVESEVGKGAKFTITLPVNQSVSNGSHLSSVVSGGENNG